MIHAEVAQLVEQRTENPCVGGSSPPLGTKKKTLLLESFYVIMNYTVIFIFFEMNLIFISPQKIAG